MLSFLFYPLSIILKNSWTGTFTLYQLLLQILYYSYYLVISWDFHVVPLMFVIGVVIGAVTRLSKSEIRTVVFYYFLLATFAIVFYVLFEEGLAVFNSFNGRLYLLSFYVLILRNGIFSLLGAIIVKKLKFPASVNRKASKDRTLLTQTTCPRCGSTFKSNPIICSYCGEIIDKERYSLLTTNNV